MFFFRRSVKTEGIKATEYRAKIKAVALIKRLPVSVSHVGFSPRMSLRFWSVVFVNSAGSGRDPPLPADWVGSEEHWPINSQSSLC